MSGSDGINKSKTRKPMPWIEVPAIDQMVATIDSDMIALEFLENAQQFGVFDEDTNTSVVPAVCEYKGVGLQSLITSLKAMAPAYGYKFVSAGTKGVRLQPLN